jgi:SAM-dependent methyltransferase
MRATIAIPLRDKVVLDLGCGDASAFAMPDYAGARLYGLDINATDIAAARARYPQWAFVVAAAERMPYAEASFDVIVSRVALPYTDIPAVLKEIYRVLKPGGEFWATLHSWGLEWAWIKAAAKKHEWRHILVGSVYVLVASAIYALTGRVIPRPWNGTQQTFQVRYRIARDLNRAGFVSVKFSRPGGNFVVTAVKSVPRSL